MKSNKKVSYSTFESFDETVPSILLKETFKSEQVWWTLYLDIKCSKEVPWDYDTGYEIWWPRQ